MLFKFGAVDCFAEEQDRYGVLEAHSMMAAVKRFLHYNKEDVDWGDYVVDGEPKIEPNPEKDGALITYKVRDLNDPSIKGLDSYVIRPADIALADWLLARHGIKR